MKTNNYLLLFLLFIPNFFYAQDGALDVTFNTTGTAVADFGINNNSSIRAMALQTDGKVIIAGTVFDRDQDASSQFALARFNPNGKPDTTFGTLGFAKSNINGKLSLHSVALQSDGRILAEGEIFNNYSDEQFVLTRFNTNGSPDTSFGNGGVVIRDKMKISTMLVQPADNKIVVAGFSFDAINRDFIMLRFNPDGSPDTNFGTDGIFTQNIGVRDFGYDMAFQPDGKIIVAGSTQNNSGERFSDFAVLRFFKDGNLDPSFGGVGSIPGTFIYDIDDFDEAKSVEVQADGKIVIAGWSANSTTHEGSYKVIQLTTDGSLDPNFGTLGVANSPISLSEQQQTLSLQQNKKILIAGTFYDGTRVRFALARFLPNGTLDSTFGNNGVVTTSDGDETYSKANAILTLPQDGKILAGGESGEANMSYHPQSVLRRYIANIVNP